MKRFAKPALAIGTSLLCLFVAEFALRKIAPVQDPYAELKVPRPEINQYIKSEHPKNLRLVIDTEAGLPGMKGPNIFTTNNMGYRGDDLTMPKPANEFRIFMVGGSTTECVYLDDSKAITRVLQNELNKQPPNNLTVKVYNAGKAGDAIDDHVSMIVHRIVQLQPDMIIVFAGINDLTRSMIDYDYLHYTRPAPFDRFRYLKYLTTESQLARRVYYLFNRNPQNFSQIFQEIHLSSDYKEKVRVCNSLPLSNERPRVNVTAFARNLRTIAGVASAQGIKLVLMTQQTTWDGPENANLKEWQWIICRSGARYREDYMNEGLTALNDQTRQVAREFSIPVYDLAGAMAKSKDFFYDDVHFNDRGAQEAAMGLAAVIQGMNLGSNQSQGK